MCVPRFHWRRALWLAATLLSPAGCGDPMPPPATSLHTPPVRDAGVDAVQQVMDRHPLFQRSPWEKATGGVRPDKGIPAPAPLDTKDVMAELTHNGARLTEDHLGRVTVVNLSHSKPNQPKKLVDAGLALLRHLPQLRVVGLYNSAVTDAGLRHLAPLGELTEVELGWTEVGDDGLRHLKGLTRLQVLGLFNTGVTDAGVEHLRGMTHLRVLSLSDTGVSDAAVDVLVGLTELRDLRVKNTKVTPQGVERLARALPRCEISR